MAILSELSLLVRRQRADMGLSQARLAQLAGVSRVTVNELETGRIGNLSLAKAERLANVLGYGIGLTGLARSEDEVAAALDAAARSASVSYAEQLPPEKLRASLAKGVVPPQYIAQLRTLLEEAPVGLLSAVAGQLEREHGIATRDTWRNMRQLAGALACQRDIWQ